MARPITTRIDRRAQVNIGQQGGGLGIFAPVNVQTPGAGADPLAGLGAALGVFSGVAAEQAKVGKAADFEQGKADEALKKTDLQRAARSQSYADGAYEVSMLRIYNDAQEKVAQRAATELDNSKTLDEKTAIIDGWMREELGPFIDDPAGRRVIAGRYQQFIEHTAGNMLAEEVQARQTAAVDTVTTDTLQRLSVGAKVTYDDIYGPLSRIFGDKSKANEQTVAIIAQMKVKYASEGKDWKALDALVPGEIVTADGQKLPGPRYTPRLRDMLDRSDEAAQRAAIEFKYPKVALESAKFEDELHGMLGRTEITDETIRRMGISVGVTRAEHMSPDRVNYWKWQSQQALLAAREKESKMDEVSSIVQQFERAADAEGVLGLSKKDIQDYFDNQVQTLLAGQGADVPKLGGSELLANRDAVTAIIDLSAKHGMVYTPMKAALSSINAAAPGDVEFRAETYHTLKARGIAANYVDPDSEALYEHALIAYEAGQRGEALSKYIRESGDKAIMPAAISEAMSPKNYKVREQGVTLSVPGRFWGTNEVNSKNTLASAYMATKHEQQTRFLVSQGIPLDKAQARATERLAETHTLVPVGDSYAVVPNQEMKGASPAAIAEAFEWLDSTLPARAKELKVPDGSTLAIAQVTGINDKGTEFRIRDRGTDVPGAYITIPDLLRAYYGAHPDKAPGKAGRKAADAKSEEVQRQRQADNERIQRERAGRGRAHL